MPPYTPHPRKSVVRHSPARQGTGLVLFNPQACACCSMIWGVFVSPPQIPTTRDTSGYLRGGLVHVPSEEQGLISRQLGRGGVFGWRALTWVGTKPWCWMPFGVRRSLLVLGESRTLGHEGLLENERLPGSTLAKAAHVCPAARQSRELQTPTN